MSAKTHFETHALNLGKLLGNLQMLEMGARMAIVKLEHHSASTVQSQLPQLAVGDTVEINAFTNNDDLRKTLEKFNKRASADLRIDVDTVVHLRDALAHGRTFGFGPLSPIRLLKFNRRSKNNIVAVELAVDMSDEWFLDNIRFLEQSFEKIRKALNYEKKAL